MSISEIAVYTDGACSGNPGPGGWAAVYVVDGKAVVKISGAEKHTTNNRMELTAVIEALKGLCEQVSAAVYSDSTYVVNAFKQNWIAGWRKRGWITTRKTPVKNRDLWEELISVTTPIQVTFNHVAGHDGNQHNELCDKLAKQAIG